MDPHNPALRTVNTVRFIENILTAFSAMKLLKSPPDSINKNSNCSLKHVRSSPLLLPGSTELILNVAEERSPAERNYCYLSKEFGDITEVKTS